MLRAWREEDEGAERPEMASNSAHGLWPAHIVIFLLSFKCTSLSPVMMSSADTAVSGNLH